RRSLRSRRTASSTAILNGLICSPSGCGAPGLSSATTRPGPSSAATTAVPATWENDRNSLSLRFTGHPLASPRSSRHLGMYMRGWRPARTAGRIQQPSVRPDPPPHPLAPAGRHLMSPRPVPPLSRRELLRVGGLALGGLGLTEVIAARAAAGSSRQTSV